MRSELFSAENLEKESAQPGLRLQNSKLLKAELNGDFMARVGSMVAYQGQVQFEALGSGGISKFLKQKLTGEGVPLMRVSGRGLTCGCAAALASALCWRLGVAAGSALFTLVGGIFALLESLGVLTFFQLVKISGLNGLPSSAK